MNSLCQVWQRSFHWLYKHYVCAYRDLIFVVSELMLLCQRYCKADCACDAKKMLDCVLVTSTEIDINKRSFHYCSMRFAGSCSRQPPQRVLGTDNAMCGVIGFFVIYFAVHHLYCPSVRANCDRRWATIAYIAVLPMACRGSSGSGSSWSVQAGFLLGTGSENICQFVWRHLSLALFLIQGKTETATVIAIRTSVLQAWIYQAGHNGEGTH